MGKAIRLPADAKRGAPMKAGKGWRLVNAKKTRSLKAALVTTYVSKGERYAVFRVAQ